MAKQKKEKLHVASKENTSPQALSYQKEAKAVKQVVRDTV
jgi:hypothetical protein